MPYRFSTFLWPIKFRPLRFQYLRIHYYNHGYAEGFRSLVLHQHSNFWKNHRIRLTLVYLNFFFCFKLLMYFQYSFGFLDWRFRSFFSFCLLYFCINLFVVFFIVLARFSHQIPVISIFIFIKAFSCQMVFFSCCLANGSKPRFFYTLVYGYLHDFWWGMSVHRP